MLLLHWKYASTSISSRSTQNYFTPTLRVNTKNIPLIFPLPFNKAPIVSCCYLPLYYSEDLGALEKKKEEKERKLEKPKLSPKLTIKVDVFSRSKLELGFHYHYHHHHKSIPYPFAIIHYTPFHYIPLYATHMLMRTSTPAIHILHPPAIHILHPPAIHILHPLRHNL